MAQKKKRSVLPLVLLIVGTGTFLGTILAAHAIHLTGSGRWAATAVVTASLMILGLAGGAYVSRRR